MSKREIFRFVAMKDVDGPTPAIMFRTKRSLIAFALKDKARRFELSTCKVLTTSKMYGCHPILDGDKQ